MIALFSRWKLKDGCPPELAAALDELAVAVEEQEPGTLIYSMHMPGPYAPIGPPPEYAVVGEATPLPPGKRNELIFFEVYESPQAFSAHLRGPVAKFMRQYRHYFATPWQGHPRPEVTYLDPRSVMVRGEMVREKV